MTWKPKFEHGQPMPMDHAAKFGISEDDRQTWIYCKWRGDFIGGPDARQDDDDGRISTPIIA